MAGDPYLQKALLDWVLGGASVNRPTTRWLDFATGTPTTSGGSSGPVPRTAIVFGAASSPAGSASNSAAVTCTVSAACTVVGWNMWDSSAAGDRLLFGTLTSSVGIANHGALSFAAGALTITLT